MLKNIGKFLTLFSFVILSCASNEKTPSAMPSSYESGESSQRGSTRNDDRMITYSISLDLSVKNTEKTKEILIEQVKNYDGFIVIETDNYIQRESQQKTWKIL